VFSPKFETVFTGPLLTTQVQVQWYIVICASADVGAVCWMSAAVL